MKRYSLLFTARLLGLIFFFACFQVSLVSPLLLKAGDARARNPLVTDPWVQLAKLTASDGKPLDQLGWSVAISGNTVVLGAPGTTVDGIDEKGAAYVFVQGPGGWANMTQTAKLSTTDGQADDDGGWSVAIDGDTIVLGAAAAVRVYPRKAGAAYVFVKPAGGWTNMTQTAKLTPSDGAPADDFANSVSVSGNTVVAGAPIATVGSNKSQGAAYVFVEPVDGWADMTETAKLTASDGAANNNFGYSVSISGNTVVAGAPNAAVKPNHSRGAAYVFVEPVGGWANMTQTAKLTAAEPKAYNELGRSVSIDGATVVAGTPQAFGVRGAAYVFLQPEGGWSDVTETAKLTASDGAAQDQLGYSVSISGDTVVGGAPHATIGSNSAQGTAYVFVQPGGGWADMTETAKLTAADGAANDVFGKSVGVSANTAVAGAPQFNNQGHKGRGAAYVF